MLNFKKGFLPSPPLGKNFSNLERHESRVPPGGDAGQSPQRQGQWRQIAFPDSIPKFLEEQEECKLLKGQKP